jgi:3-deoxy-D-arabino-heptulosonate 7-phosphate (DAHP) synthase
VDRPVFESLPGVLEVHHPDTALSDGPQSITPSAFVALMAELRQIAPILRRAL